MEQPRVSAVGGMRGLDAAQPLRSGLHDLFVLQGPWRPIG
jgi:hypothetical protein